MIMKMKIKYPNMKKIITKRYAFYIVHITSFLKIFSNIVLINFKVFNFAYVFKM
jgi:hypothetical protein